MKIISEAYEPVLTILNRFRKQGAEQRLIKFCVHLLTEDGVLLFNLLTRELVLLSDKEYQNLTMLEYLRERWFVIPPEVNEKELADFVRLILRTRRKKSAHITNYMIYPTTDCNARCFYCFQHGRSRIPMSQETAQKVVRYICTHCGGREVKLTWFGGEPLFNSAVIDTICDGLHGEGIVFTSIVVSNGYLFGDEMVHKAEEKWNVKKVQIALDGTEKVYNRSKAYIYREGSPYQVVMDNIGRLLDADMSVSIRLNMDLYNAQDLMDLVDELAERFARRKDIYVNVHHIFQEGKSMEQLHTEEGWKKRIQAMDRLVEKIDGYGMGLKRGIRKSLPVNACKADRVDAVTIAPTGEIGLCDHYSDSEFVGHIDHETFDQEMMNSWRETVQGIPECMECCFYPECIRLKKCYTGSSCYHVSRGIRLSRTRRQMLNEYRRWMDQASADEAEDDELC